MPSPVGIEEQSLSRGAQNRYHATAQAVAGDVAVIAYSVELSQSGTERRVAIRHLCSAATTPVPPGYRYRWSGRSGRASGFGDFRCGRPSTSTRLAWSADWCVSVFGTIGSHSSRAASRFGRQPVPSRRLWTVARIRLMDYDGLDVPGAPPPIDVELPPGFGLPSLRLLDVVASRVAADGPDGPARFADRYPWIWSIPVGVTAATSGLGWALLAALAVTAVGVPVLSVLFERRRRRRQLSL